MGNYWDGGLPKDTLYMLRFWCLQVCCGSFHYNESNTNEINPIAAESCLQAAPVPSWVQDSRTTNQAHGLAFLSNFCFFLPGSPNSQNHIMS